MNTPASTPDNQEHEPTPAAQTFRFPRNLGRAESQAEPSRYVLSQLTSEEQVFYVDHHLTSLISNVLRRYPMYPMYTDFSKEFLPLQAELNRLIQCLRDMYPHLSNLPEDEVSPYIYAHSDLIANPDTAHRFFMHEIDRTRRPNMADKFPQAINTDELKEGCDQRFQQSELFAAAHYQNLIDLLLDPDWATKFDREGIEGFYTIIQQAGTVAFLRGLQGDHFSGATVRRVTGYPIKGGQFQKDRSDTDGIPYLSIFHFNNDGSGLFQKEQVNLPAEDSQKMLEGAVAILRDIYTKHPKVGENYPKLFAWLDRQFPVNPSLEERA